MVVVAIEAIGTATAAGAARWQTDHRLCERQGDLPLAILPHQKA